MAAYQQYYEILGLDAPPEDRKTVKRAYSKLLKVTRPEDDPDGFMRLRDAHDIALNILAREAENAEWEARQAVVISPDISATEAEDMSSEPEPPTEPSLTYEDMLPAPEPESETSYAIGPTPSFDAPVIHAEAEPPKAPPLIKDIETILADPKHYNDREKWNQLFRKARQLDIDDYVDFEHLLLESILSFQGFYDHDNPLHDTPEKIHQKFSPSISASLFKTMSWDQVNTQGYHRGHQIEWLERRMKVRKRGAEPVPVTPEKSGGFGNVWMFLFIIFILSRIVMAIADS